MNALAIDTEVVHKTLVDFIQTQVTAAGLTRGVINLSGGLDSSVSCALAVEALGAENVLALRLPYKTSSAESLEHAQLMIEKYKLSSKTFPISTMVDALIALQPEMSPVRQGNIMARMRMIVGFDQSAACHGLVVGTGNKTEILLGYTTIYGDAACAFNPIGDLYKTQVRQLARELGIPEAIINKAPSADLWAGQTDEVELGYTYEKVDKLLHSLVDQHLSVENCLRAGFEEKFIHQVIDRVRANNFKRILAPIAKLSDTTVGNGFVNLPAWGAR